MGTEVDQSTEDQKYLGSGVGRLREGLDKIMVQLEPRKALTKKEGREKIMGKKGVNQGK